MLAIFGHECCSGGLLMGGMLVVAWGWCAVLVGIGCLFSCWVMGRLGLVVCFGVRCWVFR